MVEAKPYDIPKQLVWDAYRRVKANRGAAGVDGVTLNAFEKDLKGNLYKVWNRMASGSYIPPPVRLVEIPKGNGGTRPLGIPTVGDRIAQTVVKMVLEPLVEPHFHEDSYGYRPGKSAHDAVGSARKRCWRSAWVIDLDIKDFFGSLDHDLVLRAVHHHTNNPWVRLYIARWLKAPIAMPDGTRVERTKGTPQGGVVSPLLANLFMHYAFDAWMTREFPQVSFERYADDAVVHCVSEVQAKCVLEAIRARLEQCCLELHPTKTKLVYCKDDRHREEHEQIKFDFLGYTFQPRRAKNRWGKHFISFLPAMSTKAAKEVRKSIREWRMARNRNHKSLEDLAHFVNPTVRGWMNFYGKYYRSKCVQVLRHLNRALVAWVCRKYKRFHRRERAATHWLGGIAKRQPHLFALWQLGVMPAAGAGSRMRRESHVRFCEGGGVRFPSATRLVVLCRKDAAGALQTIRGWFESIGLTLNEQKTSVKNARRESFDFLGHTFKMLHSYKTGALYPGVIPSKKAVTRLKENVRSWLHRGNVRPLPEVIAALNRKLRGWANYFQHGSVLRTRQNLDRFVYDRVRGFLRRRNQVQTRGLRRYPREYVFGELGVVALNALPRST